MAKKKGPSERMVREMESKIEAKIVKTKDGYVAQLPKNHVISKNNQGRVRTIPVIFKRMD